MGVPVGWSPRLLAATPKQQKKYEIGGGGIGLHWPELDEDLSVAGLLAGANRASELVTRGEILLPAHASKVTMKKPLFAYGGQYDDADG